MNPGLTIAAETLQGRVPVTVFHLEGEIDSDSYDHLQTKAREAFDSGSQSLILDLTKVPYISSAGIRALHYIFNLLRQETESESDEAIRKGLRDGTFKSPHLKLLNPQPKVEQVLKSTGYDMFLEIHRDLLSAVNSF
jgi:anti-anti-sigma factor